MNDEIILRAACPGDAPALLEIYAPYVRETAITFEYDVPSPEEFAGRIEKTLSRYPYLVAARDGQILGYAYAGTFQERAAYGWACELSVYLRQEARRQGLGRRLYDALEACLRAQGILNLEACIAVPEAEDAFLSRDSVRFHTQMGFRTVGEFRRCGYKFHRWYDMVWMEKWIGEHVTDQPAVLPFSAVAPALRAQGVIA